MVSSPRREASVQELTARLAQGDQGEGGGKHSAFGGGLAIQAPDAEGYNKLAGGEEHEPPPPPTPRMVTARDDMLKAFAALGLTVTGFADSIADVVRFSEMTPRCNTRPYNLLWMSGLLTALYILVAVLILVQIIAKAQGLWWEFVPLVIAGAVSMCLLALTIATNSLKSE